MAEEIQDVASAPQESEMSADQLWDAVDQEDTADNSGSDTAEPETREVAETETTEGNEVVEEPEHDWQKRYKDLEKDYHSRNEKSASYRRETDSKVAELERQLQALQIERLENQEKFKKLSELEKVQAEEKPQTIDSLLSDTDKQTMKDFEEVMSVVNKIVDYKVGQIKPDTAPITDLQSKYEETQKALQDMQYQRLVQHYDTVMKQKVGDDYLEIDTDPNFVEYVNANTVLKDILSDKSPDPEKHAWVVNTWLNTDDGRAFRAKKKGDEPATKASPKQEQKREVAKSLAKNTAPPQEVDTENMTEDELWNHIVTQEE